MEWWERGSLQIGSVLQPKSSAVAQYTVGAFSIVALPDVLLRRFGAPPGRAKALGLHSENSWKFLRRPDPQLFIDVFLAKHHFNVRYGHPKLGCQKSHHVVCGFAIPGRDGDADFQLRAFGLADGVLAGRWFTQNVDDERVAIPGKKRVSGGVAGAAGGHGGMILPWFLAAQRVTMVAPLDRFIKNNV